MTDSADTADDHVTAPQGRSDSPITSAEASTVRGGSVWGKLNRTNRILTIVLGGSLAVLVIGVAFGVGVFVGAEHGGYDERGGGAGSSEYSGEYGDSPHEHRGREQDAGAGGDTAGAGESADADNGGHSEQPTRPESPGGGNIAPPPVPGPPR